MESKNNCLMQGCADVDAKGRRCQGCGFDTQENTRRRMILRYRGLTKSPETGLYRLVIHRRKERK